MAGINRGGSDSVVERRSLRANFTYVFLEKAISAICGLLLVPIIIRSVGTERYGFWVVLSVIASYLLLFQMGLSFSFEKYIAEFRAVGKTDAIRRLVETSLSFMLGLVSLLFVTVLIFAAPVIRFFTRVDASGEDVFLLMLICGSALVSLVGQVYGSVPRAYQRFDLSSLWLIGARVVHVSAAFVLLHMGYGLTGVAYAGLLYCLVYVVSGVIMSRHLLGYLPVPFGAFDPAMLKMQYAFGVRVQTSNIAFWLVQNLDRFLVARYIGLAEAGFLDIGTKIVYAIREGVILLFGVLIPRASELSARREYQVLKRLYVVGTNSLTMLAAASIAALFVGSEQILFLWLGAAPEPQSIFAMRIVAIGAFVHVTSGFGSAIQRGMGFTGYELAANSCMAAVNVAACFVLLRYFGFQGVIIGTLCAYCTAPFVIAAITNRLLHVSGAGFWWRTYALQGALSLVATFAGTMWLQYAALFLGDTLHGRFLLLASTGGVAVVTVVAGNAVLNRSLFSELAGILKRQDSGEKLTRT